jgi:hypothetical protein
MSNDYKVSLVAAQENFNTTVLRIVSAAKNSITQFYTEKVLIDAKAIESLNRKIIDKLKLHYINDINLSASIQFENNRTANFDSIDQICKADFNNDSLTQLIVLKWTFIFDSSGEGAKNLHSIYVRISEGPNPGMVIQKLLSSRNEDLESLDNEAFAPIVCKVDFMESRFSNEILSITTEWVKALPKAEPISNIINWLRKYERNIDVFTSRTFPTVVVFAYIGVWLGIISNNYSASVKYASAWVLGGRLFTSYQYILYGN